MSNISTHRAKRRFLPLVWAASAVSAAVLVLGVNGTLSAWTSAVITNDTNTVATGNAVILKESSGATNCYSSDNATNTYTCSTINKYGGVAVPLTPGTSQQVDVSFQNIGKANASTFKLHSGACSQTPTASTSTVPPVNNLCTTANELTVNVSCSDGGSYSAASAWTDLKYGPGTPSGLPLNIGTALTHTATLAANAQWTCRFTVALSANANVTDQGIVVSQPLTWTLA